MLVFDPTKAIVPPLSGDGVPAVLTPQLLTDVGANETHNNRKLTPGHVHYLVVGAVPVYAAWYGTPDVVNAVANTNLLLPAGTIFPFLAIDCGNSTGSTYVYVEEAGGPVGYQVWVFQAGR